MKPSYLHDPTFLELDDTFRSLPVLGSVQIKTSIFEQTLQDLEKIGFVAIEVTYFGSQEPNQTIQAFKGKHGPCYYSGKTVTYTGAALAALDDDNHLLIAHSSKIVCDKTYTIFGLPSYQDLIKRTEVPESVKEVPDDFESSQTVLFEKLKNIQARSEQRKTLFYPGPFRLLILADGSIVYRGQWCSIPTDLSEDLIRKDGCVEAKDERQGLSSYFQEEYGESGSAWLLNDFKAEVQHQPTKTPDFSRLSSISKELKGRLLNTIESHKKYFILIGNEAEDKLGCCPSQEVTEANLLVRHGILSSLAESLQGDSCPVTMYAFKDELTISSKGFSSKINDEFRESVRSTLSKPSNSGWMYMIKWMLLGFVFFSLYIAAKKCQTLQTPVFSGSLYEQLDVSQEGQYVLVLFHNQKRCYQCQEMEKHTKDLLLGIDLSEIQSEELIFKTVVIDDPQNADMVEMLGIFAPTLVLMEFEQKALSRSKVLLDATELYRDELAFKDHIEIEIHQFMKENE